MQAWNHHYPVDIQLSYNWPHKEFDVYIPYIFTVDPCENSPCKNEGKCESDGGTFSCECKKGFTGKTCEIEGDYVTYLRNLQGFSIMSVSTSYVVAVISDEFKMFLPVCM